MVTAYEQWVAQSRYDLETAWAMEKAQRWLYVVFCCQQAAEKMIKAIIARKSGSLPPKIHNLARLIEVSGVSPSKEQSTFFRKLSAYYIQSRYPEEIAELSQGLSPETAREVLSQTEEALKWLSSIP